MSSKFLIDDVNFELLVKKLEANAFFTNNQSWEEMFDSILKALKAMKNDLVSASMLLEKRRENFEELGKDRPTDLQWTLSLLFVIRTIGMLYSKSTSEKRTFKNNRSHKQLLDHYFEILQSINDKKTDLLEIFPH